MSAGDLWDFPNGNGMAAATDASLRSAYFTCGHSTTQKWEKWGQQKTYFLNPNVGRKSVFEKVILWQDFQNEHELGNPQIYKGNDNAEIS